MTNLGSALRSSEEPRPAPILSHRAIENEQNGPMFLELRTGTETIYLRPTWWQRARLQWTFRHFHVLPAQVLSRGDQRLVDKLSRSAVVHPSLPVAGDSIFGVVEKVPSKKPPASANRVIPLRTEPAAMPGPLFSAKDRTRPPARLKTSYVLDIPPGPWAALGVLAAVGVIVVVASAYFRPFFSNTGLKNPPVHAANDIKPAPTRSPDLHPAAADPHPVSAASASFLDPAKPSARIAAPAPELTLVHESSSFAASSSAVRPAQPTSSASRNRTSSPASATVPDTNTGNTIPGPGLTALPAPSERRFVSELPQGHFAHPVVSDPNLVGELQLKALIGADGSVKQVTVLSGNPGLAEAGMRAVRQWHYNPSQVIGSPAEVETRIRMNFFGGDGVSIASVPGQSASQSK